MAALGKPGMWPIFYIYFNIIDDSTGFGGKNISLIGKKLEIFRIKSQ